MGIKVITPPTAEQISLAEARLHLRLDDDGESPAAHPDDTLLAWMIPSARQYCEGWTERALATQTLELALDEFPAAEIQIPRSPIQGIVSVKYMDGDGVEQTLAASAYTLDDYQEPGWVLPAVDTTWPATQAVVNAVKIRYLAGYSLPNVVQTHPLPSAIKAAMLLVLGALYENREQSAAVQQHELPLGVFSLLRPYQLRQSMA